MVVTKICQFTLEKNSESGQVAVEEWFVDINYIFSEPHLLTSRITAGSFL